MSSVKKHSILIVDDETELCDLIGFQFEIEGFDVHKCFDGDSALKFLNDNKVDVVLSDVRMPRGDGTDLLKNLSTKGIGDLHFYFMTGFADLTLEQAREMGAKGIFNKPFDGKFVLDSILDNLNN